MKLLLDENLSHRLVARLTEAFPGTASVYHVGLDGQPDSALWDYAAEHDFVIVSKDDDFRQMSFFQGHPPKIVWLVVGNAGTDPIADLLLRNQSVIALFIDRTEDALLTLSLEND